MARVRSSDPIGFPFADLESALREWPTIELLGLLPGSSNHTLLARVDGGDGDAMLAVYKPARGERPLWDFPAGSLYRREVAAYRVARRLGWPAIPPTVVREEAPLGEGALQWFVEADTDQHYLNFQECPEEVSMQVAVFDLLVNNADRKAGHFLLDEEGTVWLIDHGLTFHVEPKIRTVVWDFAERAMPDQLRSDLRSLLDDLASSGTIRSQLTALLSGSEVRALTARVRAMLAPSWRFPGPSSAWSIPWPPI